MKTLTIELKDGKKAVGTIIAPAKVFSTGSKGFFGTAKIVIAGKSYQCQVQAVEIGTKKAKKK